MNQNNSNDPQVPQLVLIEGKKDNPFDVESPGD
jgi:hypothetical protein